MKITKLLRTPGILSVALALTTVGIQAPVMADMVGTPALGVILIFVLLDLLGATNIFPSI